MTDVQPIPKKIHYVWLGGKPLPPAMREFIDGWRRLMPEFEVCEWNEKNFDMSSHPWMERMQSEKKYGFASDYVRLSVLRDHGGIYLDTDMQLKKSLAPFLGEQCFVSFEFDHFLSSAIIGCRPGHPMTQTLLDLYDGQEGQIVSNTVFTRYFIDAFPEFRLNNQDQIVGDDIRIFPKEYFILPTNQKDKGFSRHLAFNQWKPKRGQLRPGKIVSSIIGEVLFYKLLNIKMGLGSDFQAMEKARRKK